MLTATREADGRKIGAWEAEKSERPFVCHCCGSVVTLRKGGVRAAHFAHQPPVTCEYGAGESEAHRRCKIEIYENLLAHPRAAKCEMERNLGTVRPDVSAYIDGVPIAIEVQASNLTLEKIAYRTSEYARKGIYLLWLPLFTDALTRDLYDPRPWERWLHAAYFGRVYYWIAGLRVRPVHFRDYHVRVSGRTRDYQRLSRFKVPLASAPLNLAEDFRPRCREEFTPRDLITIPRARLFVSHL